MNFITNTNQEAAEELLDLKYCERCGGLWLRPQGRDSVYCGSCKLRLEAMPNPGTAMPARKQRGKTRRNRPEFAQAKEVVDQIGYLEGVAAMEVWA